MGRSGGGLQRRRLQRAQAQHSCPLGALEPCPPVVALAGLAGLAD